MSDKKSFFYYDILWTDNVHMKFFNVSNLKINVQVSDTRDEDHHDQAQLNILKYIWGMVISQAAFITTTSGVIKVIALR